MNLDKLKRANELKRRIDEKNEEIRWLDDCLRPTHIFWGTNKFFGAVFRMFAKDYFIKCACDLKFKPYFKLTVYDIAALLDIRQREKEKLEAEFAELE